jgi:hypothetical protein
MAFDEEHFFQSMMRHVDEEEVERITQKIPTIHSIKEDSVELCKDVSHRFTQVEHPLEFIIEFFPTSIKAMM